MRTVLSTVPMTGLVVIGEGVAKRETTLMGLVNVGVPASSYTSFTVDDPGSDVGSPEDDRSIRIFDQQPATRGLDRVNPPTFRSTPSPSMSSATVILITGAARRIGAGIARELHARGSDVVIHHRQSAAAAPSTS